LIFSYFLHILILFSSFIYSEEKSSKEIQQDINHRKSELKSLRSEIKIIEERLLEKNKEAINTTEILIDLKNKIQLTEKLIKSLNKEEKHISNLIFEAETEISKNESLINKLKKQLINRLIYLYINGQSNFIQTILESKDWNSAIYRIKYLEIMAIHEQKLRTKMLKTIDILNKEKINLVKERKIRTSQIKEKKQENDNLERDKRKRNNLLSNIKKDRSQLEKSRTEKNQMISNIESLISKLYADKESMKKREQELARIRAQQQKATTGNFLKMKGYLNWPVEGDIISKFGTSRNKKTGVIIENVGIDISSKSGAPVKSVLDGVVSTITYIRGHGNIIIIDHGGGFSTVYAKIDNIKINENDYVQIGKTIANVAIPEDNSNPKLHFEVWGNQKKHNPEIWLKKK